MLEIHKSFLSKGIHLSPAPLSYHILNEINNNDFVLLEEFSPCKKVIIKNINDQEYSQNIDYPLTEFSFDIKKSIEEILPHHHQYLYGRKLELNIIWHAICVTDFNDDLVIKAEGRCTAYFKCTEKRYISFDIIIENGKSIFHIKSIRKNWFL